MFGLHEDWVQELKNEDIVNSVHIPTDKNLADNIMMTKGLGAAVRLNLEKCLSDIAEAVATASNKVAKKKLVIRRAAK